MVPSFNASEGYAIEGKHLSLSKSPMSKWSRERWVESKLR
jgi:hypothetical protein